MDNIECKICKSRSKYLISKDGYDHYLCSECSLVFVYPSLNREYISNEIYSEKNNYQKNKKNKIVVKRPTDKQEKIFRFISLTQGKSILDIGSSNGEFMIFCKERGLDVKGVEINKSTADFALSLGLSVFNGPIESYDTREKFDYVYLGDVIEHVEDPVLLIKKCKDLLKDNGYIIVITPNLDSVWSKLTYRLYKYFKIPWSSLEPPYHLSNFKTKTIQYLFSSLNLKMFSKWKNKMPTLKYELGSLHLVKRYKKEKTMKNFIFVCFAFILYTLIYMINKIFHPFFREGFSMTYIAKK